MKRTLTSLAAAAVCGGFAYPRIAMSLHAYVQSGGRFLHAGRRP